MRGLATILLVTGLASVGPAAAAENKDGIAVIVGNRNYGANVPSVDYAHYDAEAMKRYVADVLGYRNHNIFDLRDATKAQLETVFGNRDSHQGRLFDIARPDRSEVVVFYSGHGVPGKNDRRGYLLPVDAHPDKPQLAGYPLDQLYANLASLRAKSVTVFIDACFSGESAGGMLVNAASNIGLEAAPVRIDDDRLTVLTAARGRELANWDPDARHGLFTEYLLRGLYGGADLNHDRKITAREIMRFLDDEMPYQARRLSGRNQNPDLHGNPDVVVAFSSGGRFPARPAISELNVTMPPAPRRGRKPGDTAAKVASELREMEEAGTEIFNFLNRLSNKNNQNNQ